MNFFGPPIGLVLAVGGSVAAHLLAWGLFVTRICGVSDPALRWPADASAQGWTCGANAADYGHVPAAWALGASAILAVAFVVAVWSRGGSWRWVSPLPLLVTPALAVALLSLPPNNCGADQRQTHTPAQCATTRST